MRYLLLAGALALALAVPRSPGLPVSPASARQASGAASSYVFSYFINNGEDGLHLLSSADGLAWTPLNGGRSFLHPAVGSRLMRDPSITRGPDGMFHLVPRLSAYTHRRLLGEHVPYAVEAYPEGGQAHLSAESALYCRIFVEGMFGIRPAALNAFEVTPRLPDGWDRMALRAVHAFGRVFDVEVTRRGRDVRVRVVADRGPVVERTVPPGGTVSVVF